MALPLAFIAGPFRGPTAWHIAENVRWAERYALAVAKLGAFPICPQANSAHFFGQLSEENFWIPGYQRVLDLCDCMVLIRGWEQSVGARAERQRMIDGGRDAAVFNLGYFDTYIEQNRDYDRLQQWIDAFCAARTETGPGRC